LWPANLPPPLQVTYHPRSYPGGCPRRATANCSSGLRLGAAKTTSRLSGLSPLSWQGTVRWYCESAAQCWATGMQQILFTTTVVVAGSAIAGMGVANYHASRRNLDHAIGKVDGSTQTESGDLQKNAVQALINKSNAELRAYRKAESQARSAEERQDLARRHLKSLETCALALFDVAKLNPGTPLAEEALVWIVTHHPPGPIVEQATEVIIRDHIQSDSIEPLFKLSTFILAASSATERLMREALAKNPHRTVQGLACFTLARYLDYHASFVCRNDARDPAQWERKGPTSTGSRGRHDYIEHLNKLGPEALDREAASRCTSA
jgi:hypothetical protein